MPVSSGMVLAKITPLEYYCYQRFDSILLKISANWKERSIYSCRRWKRGEKSNISTLLSF